VTVLNGHLFSSVEVLRTGVMASVGMILKKSWLAEFTPRPPASAG
jgi:hypothetical protein